MVFILDMQRNKLYEHPMSAVLHRVSNTMMILRYCRILPLFACFFAAALSLVFNVRLLFGLNTPWSENALNPVQTTFPFFTDDLAFKHLPLAIRRNIAYLKRLDPEKIFHYGPHRFSCRQVLDSQAAFLDLITRGLSGEGFNRAIREQFRIYRASGREGSNKVLFTGYYAPVFDAGPIRTSVFKYPLYRKPDDLVRIDLSLFDDKYKGEQIVARIGENQVRPYYTRYQIEIEKVLEGKSLEIAWLKDPMDVYLLHIEGAGRLRFPDGSIVNVNYAASNGRPYRSFGRFLLENGYVTADQLSLDKIRRYLSENPAVFTEVFNHNGSYVFFKPVENGPLGNINVPLTMGRSLALDAGLFPKGALAYIASRKPTIGPSGKVVGWSDFSRFVLNQDTGAAIKGAGRADLFWGSGPEAETAAWNQKHDGDLYVLIKKH